MTAALRTGRAPVPPAAFAKLVVSEARLAWRSPRGLVFGIGLPIGLLVVFGELPHYEQHPASSGGLSRFDAEIPVLAAFVIATLALALKQRAQWCAVGSEEISWIRWRCSPAAQRWSINRCPLCNQEAGTQFGFRKPGDGTVPGGPPA